PVGAGGPEAIKAFVGLIDIVKMKALILLDEQRGGKWDEIGIPDDMIDQANEYREQMMETIATQDEDLMDKYLGGEEVSEAAIKSAIRKGNLAFDFVPILCCSGLQTTGEQPQ